MAQFGKTRPALTGHRIKITHCTLPISRLHTAHFEITHCTLQNSKLHTSKFQIAHFQFPNCAHLKLASFLSALLKNGLVTLFSASPVNVGLRILSVLFRWSSIEREPILSGGGARGDLMAYKAVILACRLPETACPARNSICIIYDPCRVSRDDALEVCLLSKDQ